MRKAVFYIYESDVPCPLPVAVRKLRQPDDPTIGILQGPGIKRQDLTLPYERLFALWLGVEHPEPKRTLHGLHTVHVHRRDAEICMMVQRIGQRRLMRSAGILSIHHAFGVHGGCGRRRLCGLWASVI